MASTKNPAKDGLAGLVMEIVYKAAREAYF
jgi:hypothetical protein